LYSLNYKKIINCYDFIVYFKYEAVMNKILDNRIALGLSMASALAGVGVILGGVFGRNFWLIVGGSALAVGPLILVGAFKVREIYQQKQLSKVDGIKPEPIVSVRKLPPPGSKVIVMGTENTMYIPNPGEYAVFARENVLRGHAQSTMNNLDDGEL
jgi:hypothetical protein